MPMRADPRACLNCGGPYYARNRCYRCYERVYREWRRDPSRPRCTIQGCTHAVKARGLCGTHYEAWRHLQAPPCVNGDGRRAAARGLCWLCYRRWLKEDRHAA
jgi:hypothetical protein